jgi:transposase
MMVRAQRYELTDVQWERVAGFLPGKASDPGRTGGDNRLFVNGVLWVLRSGAHWRDLPERYGKWKTVHKRFTRWAKTGVWERLFASLIKDRNNDYLMLDRKRGARSQALGRSRGGLTTKIHMLADGLGRPLRFILTPGQAGDAPQAAALLDGFSAKAVLADTAYDSNALRQLIADAGALAVIPSNPPRKIIIPHDKSAYRQRNRIERCFNKLKHCRRFATRYDRRAAHFLAFIHIAAAMIWMR